MAMAAKFNDMAPQFNHQYSYASGVTWGDKWDYNEKFSSEGCAKRKSKLGDCNKMRSVASTGFEKAKSAASTGAMKAKSGTSTSLRWIKILYHKRTSHTSHEQASKFKYKIH